MRKSKRYWVALAAISSLGLAGCTESAIKRPGPTTSAAPTHRATIVAQHNRCEVEPSPGTPGTRVWALPLAAAAAAVVLPAMFQLGVKSMSAAARKAGTETTVSFRGTANTNLYQVPLATGGLTLEPTMRCIDVAVGDVVATSVSPTAPTVSGRAYRQVGDYWVDPEFFATLRLTLDQTRKAFAYEVIALQYVSRLDNSRLTTAARNLSIALTLYAPGETEKASALASGLITVPGIRPGYSAASAEGIGPSTGWLALPAPGDTAKEISESRAAIRAANANPPPPQGDPIRDTEKGTTPAEKIQYEISQIDAKWSVELKAARIAQGEALGKKQTALANAWGAYISDLNTRAALSLALDRELKRELIKEYKSSGATRVTPVVLDVVVSETREQRDFLIFIADILDQTGPDLSKEFANAVLPEKRKAAAEAEASASEAAAIDLKSAELEVAIAQAALTAATTDDARIQAQIKLDIAKMKANAAARKAGLGPRYAI